MDTATFSIKIFSLSTCVAHPWANLVELWARGARCPIAFLIAYELQEGEDVKGQHNYAQNKKNQVPQHIAWHPVNKRSDTY
jgi:hypothetical protein